MKVEDTKSGNPYHDEKGQFTEKDSNVSNVDEEDSLSNDDLELDDLDENDEFDIDLDESDELDIDLDDLDDDDVYNVDVEENVAVLSDEEIAKIDSLNFGEAESFLIKQYPNEFDKEKIFNASPEELRELIKAKKLLDEKAKLVASNKELNELNDALFYNLWQEDVSAADWISKKSKWDSKLNYFENFYNKEDKNQKIQDLLKFKQLGELYEQSYNELTSSFKRAEEIVNAYLDPNNAYSQARKDKAVWFKDNVISKSIEKFGKHADKLIDELKAYNPKAWEAIYFYTGSYHIINEPLRKETYSNSDPSPFGFVKTVQKMTEAIDSSTYDFDYWCQRGTNKLKISDSLTIDGYTDEQELQKLVGQTFKHQSFYSAGAGKGTGFNSSSIILNTYCPKGTKGFYMNTQGYYSGGGENEMILQRGYSYKINKIEKHGYKIYIDVDVILGSDSEKYNTEELQQLKEKYVPYS